MKYFGLMSLVFALALSACATTRSGHPAGFTEPQARALIGEGFKPTPRGFELGIEDRLLFAVNEAEVKAGQLTRLTRMAMVLHEVGIARLKVEGHTDSTGRTVFNQALSGKRARAVIEALARGGLDRDGLQAEGFGARNPVESNRTSRGRAQNRRVVIIVPPQG